MGRDKIACSNGRLIARDLHIIGQKRHKNAKFQADRCPDVPIAPKFGAHRLSVCR